MLRGAVDVVETSARVVIGVGPTMAEGDEYLYVVRECWGSFLRCGGWAK